MPIADLLYLLVKFKVVPVVPDTAGNRLFKDTRKSQMPLNQPLMAGPGLHLGLAG